MVEQWNCYASGSRSVYWKKAGNRVSGA